MEAEGSTAHASGGHADEPEDWDGGEAFTQPLRVRPKPYRLVAQVVLAGLGILVFVALVLFWLESNTTEVTNWLIVLLVLLVFILVAEILLFSPATDGMFNTVPRNLPAPEGEEAFVVGCPGCGTVFTATEEELQEGDLSCHNCGRKGYVKDESLSQTAIKEETCTTCGNNYFEYLEHSECPVCHTFNDY